MRAAVSPSIPPVLYSQNDNPQGLSLNGQDYDVQFSTFSLQEADDFTITGGQTWKLQQIDVAGVDHGPGVPFATVEIYADAGGVPGSEVAVAMRKPVAEVDGDLTIKLGTTGAITLGAGTYWLSVYSDMDFPTHAQWYWSARSVQNGNPAAFQNPGNGWGYNCPSWSGMLTCVPDIGGPDLMFDLRGHLAG